MWEMTSIMQHNFQRTEQLTAQTWGRGCVVLVVSTTHSFHETLDNNDLNQVVASSGFSENKGEAGNTLPASRSP